MKCMFRLSGTTAFMIRYGRPLLSSCLSGKTHWWPFLCFFPVSLPFAFSTCSCSSTSLSLPVNTKSVCRRQGSGAAVTSASFAPCRSVGVQGDQRTHSHVVALRAVTSSDGMTADWYPFEPAFLRAVSTRICNQVRSVNRVVYDVTSKPPGTIEWE